MPKHVSISKREFSYWEREALRRIVEGFKRSWEEITRDRTYSLKETGEAHLMFRDYHAAGHPISDKMHRAGVALLEEYGIPYTLVFPRGEMPKISAQCIRTTIDRRKAFWRYVLKRFY